MGSRRVLFEGKIDRLYSQIYFDQEKNQYVLMQEIKEYKRNKAIKQIVDFNKGKKPEEKLGVVARLYKNKKTDFVIGRIPERLAKRYVRENQKNQIQGESKIRIVPKDYNPEKPDLMSYINEELHKVKVAGQNFFKNADKETKLKLIAMLTLTSMAISGASIAIHNMINGNQAPEPTPPGYTISVPSQTTQNPTDPEDNKYYVDLKDVDPETDPSGKLTSESAKELTSGIVNEIDELYDEADWETPKVINSETLTSLFYVENSLKPEDSKDAYVGIGQMSKGAIKEAIKRANTLYGRASSNGSVEGIDNYIVDNICSKKNEGIDEQVNRLWEQSKTDPVMCGCLTGLYLADLSDRYESSLNGNEAAIIIMYNAGEGNFVNYQKLGIITLSSDKTGMKIDLEKVDKLDSPAKIAKWNEAVNYVIKVLEGSKRLKENPNADVCETCEQVRIDVGTNDNYSDEPNLNQYNFAPNGVVFVVNERGLDSHNDPQPGV